MTDKPSMVTVVTVINRINIGSDHNMVMGPVTLIKYKRGNEKAPKQDMRAEHGIGKSSESTTVTRKRDRPKKQTEASFGRSEELPDMCAAHGLEKSPDVERKRIRLGEVLTLQQLLTKGVGWFTIQPSVTIVALGRRRYSYHHCVEYGKKGLREKGNMVALNILKQKQNKHRLRVLLRQGDLNIWVTAFDKVAVLIIYVCFSQISALSTTTEGSELLGDWVEWTVTWPLNNSRDLLKKYTIQSMDLADTSIEL